MSTGIIIKYKNETQSFRLDRLIFHINKTLYINKQLGNYIAFSHIINKEPRQVYQDGGNCRF